MQDFVRPVRILTKLKLVLVRPVPRITWEGLRPFGTKSRKTRACPCHSGTQNQASGTSYVRFKVVRRESMSSSGWYEVKLGGTTSVSYEVTQGELVHIHLVQRIKQAGLRLFGT